MRYLVRTEPTFAMTPTGHPAEGYWSQEYTRRGWALRRAVSEARFWAYTGPRGQQETLATVTLVEAPA